MITPPDETYSTAEAARLLDISERQCARYLASGLIRAQRPNGRWRVTALALWQHLGIETEMMRLWLDYCRQLENQESAAEPSAFVEAEQPPRSSVDNSTA